MVVNLPEGARGRALAWGLAVATVLLVWVAGIMPVWSWYDARTELLDRRQALAGRMAALARSLPALQAMAAAGGGGDTPVLLEGATDAIASAKLLGGVQAMAGQVGVLLASVEALPGEAPGGAALYRRISLRVSINGNWDRIVGLLQALEQATPRLLVDDMHLRALQGRAGADAETLDGSLTITALRAGAAP